MNDSPRTGRERNHPIRILDGYEVALRGLLAHHHRALPIVEALQAEHPELTAGLLGEMLSCDPEHAISSLIKLKEAVERKEAS